MKRSKMQTPRFVALEPVRMRRPEPRPMRQSTQDNDGGGRIGWAVVRGIGAAAALIVLCLIFVAASAARAGGF